MKWILCLAILFKCSTSLAQTYTIPESSRDCKKSNTGTLALKLEKGNENIFQIGIKLEGTCEIKEVDFFRLYWFVDEGSDSHCESLTGFEKKFFKFKYDQIQRMTPNRIKWKTDVAAKIIKKAKKNGYDVKPWLEISSEKVGDQCVTKSYLTVNKELMELDEMRLKLRFLKVKSVSTFLQDQFLIKLF